MAGRKLFIVSSINSGERIVKRMISMHLMRESGGAGLRKERAPRLRGRKKIKRVAWGTKRTKKQEGSCASLLRGHIRIYLSAATDLTTLTSRPL